MEQETREAKGDLAPDYGQRPGGDKPDLKIVEETAQYRNEW